MDDHIYLAHHGIKGQKWGVRHGPPYPIEDKTLKKGMRLNSVSGISSGEAYKSRGVPMYTYNPDDKWDSSVYKGPFSYYMRRMRGVRTVTEHQYEVISDLKMPSKDERVKAFKDLYGDKKFRKPMIRELEDCRKQLVLYGIGSSTEMKKRIKEVNLRDLKTDSDYETAYEIFNHAMEDHWRHKSTREYMNRMSSEYDAMVDDNNQGIYNDAHDPVIVFRANEVLKLVGSTPVSDLEIVANYNQVYDVMSKEGKSVKL